MATYPESSPAPSYPLIVTQRWNTSKIDLGGDRVVIQKRSSIIYPIYDVIVSYPAIALYSSVQVLWNFFKARRGAYEPFYIYDLIPDGELLSHVDEFCGVGDGVETTFDIPARSTSAQTIYVSGVAQTLTTDYTISLGTGISNADQVVFEAASVPASGSVVTATFLGCLRMRVCFESDELKRSYFEDGINGYGSIKLVGQEPFA